MSKLFGSDVWICAAAVVATVNTMNWWFDFKPDVYSVGTGWVLYVLTLLVKRHWVDKAARPKVSNAAS